MTAPPGASSPPPHTAFLEARALTTEGSAEWHALTAGYAALQLFDVWAGCDCGALALDTFEVRRVRKYLEAVAESAAKNCLAQLVDVIEQTPTPRGSAEAEERGHLVGRALTAYAKLLQYEAKWAVAQDVHQTLITFAKCVNDEGRLLDSMLMVGFSQRMQSQFDRARETYAALAAAAVQANNRHYQLQSQLGFAKIAIDQGNLSGAVPMLDTIIEAARPDHPLVLGRALTDRARVASQLGDYHRSVVFGHQALEYTHDPMERDRVLGNLAVSFTHLRLRDQARDANLILAASAQEVSVRWVAQINLMELAYLDGHELVFEQYRRSMANVELPPYIQAVYYETLAHGCRTFGRLEEATHAFQHMLEVGERHGLNEFVIKAETALKDVTPAVLPGPGVPQQITPTQPEIARIARAISDMRENIGLTPAQELPHVAFFTTLAALTHPDPVWRAVSAGLLVLQLVDTWLVEGTAVVAAERDDMRALTAAIDALPTDQPARILLRGVVDALQRPAPQDLFVVAPRLLAYARGLDLEKQWALAADVYATVLRHLDSTEEPELVIMAHLRRGVCHQHLGSLDEAARDYAAAQALSEATEHRFGMVRARLGAAQIALARGQLPAAEALLDQTLVEAAQHEIAEVWVAALHDRAVVAHQRGHYIQAVQLGYRALEHTTEPGAREQVLSDIASAFAGLGLWSVARDVYGLLEATAQGQAQRWTAAIHVMELAARAGAIPMFEQYRHRLELLALPLFGPAQEARFYVHLAESYAALGKVQSACEAAIRARRMAEAAQLPQLCRQASVLLQQARSMRSPRASSPARVQPTEEPVPADLRAIVAELTHIRRSLAS